jgi:hypothetical protein
MNVCPLVHHRSVEGTNPAGRRGVGQGVGVQCADEGGEAVRGVPGGSVAADLPAQHGVVVRQGRPSARNSGIAARKTRARQRKAVTVTGDRDRCSWSTPTGSPTGLQPSCAPSHPQCERSLRSVPGIMARASAAAMGGAYPSTIRIRIVGQSAVRGIHQPASTVGPVSSGNFVSHAARSRTATSWAEKASRHSASSPGRSRSARRRRRPAVPRRPLDRDRA